MNKCGFCHRGEEATECGSLHCDELGGKVIAAHHKCMQYSAGLRQYKSDQFGGFKLKKVKAEISRASRLNCNLCRTKGASGGCAWAPCKKGYHYPCAFHDENKVTKRYKVASGAMTVIMYRVFCSIEHEQTYRKNIKAGNSVVTDQGKLSSERTGSSHASKVSKKETETNDESGSEVDSEDDHKPTHRSNKHDISIRSVDPNETVSSCLDSPRMTEQEVLEETKKEFLMLKQREKRKAEDMGSVREKRLKHSENKNNNCSDSPSLMNTPARVTRNSPALNTDGVKLQTNHFDLSHSLSPEASDTETEKPDDDDVIIQEEVDVSDSDQVTLLIPSLLTVPRSELDAVHKELGISSEKSVVWPPSGKAATLQDKHLPHLMWCIVESVRNGKFEDVTSILNSPSGKDYDYFVNFHAPQHDSVIQQVFHNIAEKLAAMNAKSSEKVGQLVSRKYQKMKVLVLYLSSKCQDHRKVMKCIQSVIYEWRKDTIMKNTSAIPSKEEKEFEVLWNWLKARLNSRFQVDTCPVEEVFINERYSSEVTAKLMDRLSVHPHSSSFGSNTSVSVLAVNSANRDILKYDCFIRHAVEKFFEVSMCSEMFFIIGIHREDTIQTMRDILPTHLVMEGEVYTAFNPEETCISCIVVHVRKEERKDQSECKYGKRVGISNPASSSSAMIPAVRMSPLRSER